MTEEQRIDFPRLFRRFLEKKGFASGAAAARAGRLSVGQVNDLLAGRKVPSIATVHTIVQALGGTMAELFEDQS